MAFRKMHRTKTICMFALALLCILIVVIAGCGGSKNSSSNNPTNNNDPNNNNGGNDNPKPVAVTTTLIDDSGQQVTSVPGDTPKPIFIAVDGLNPGQDVEIMLYKGGKSQYPAPLQLTADDTGKVPASAILYDIGIDPATGTEVDASGDYELKVVGYGVDKTIPFTIGAVSRSSTSVPSVYPMVKNLSGNFIHPQGSVMNSARLYAKGKGFPANSTVDVYVLPDQNDWTDQSLGGAVTAPVSVTTDASGSFEPVAVWNVVQPVNNNRDFDVIVDANRNGIVDDGDAVNGNSITGFTVQDLNGATAVPLASDRNGTYRSQYTTSETLTIWVNPPGRPTFEPVENKGRWVKKYVVIHKNTWNSQDPLIDVTGRPERDLVRYACANEYYYPIWSAPLKAGKYDVIIDANCNGKWDPGIDLIHSFGGQNYVTITGDSPARLIASADSAVINKGETVKIFVTALAEDTTDPVPGVTISLARTGGSGSVSPASAVTNSEGVAEFSYTGDARNIINTLTATASGYESATCSIRTRPGGDVGITIQ